MSSKILLILALCLFGTIQAVQQNDKLIDKLTDSEIRRIFRRNRNKIPNYKIIKLHTANAYRSKRDVRPVEFEVDEEKVVFNLKNVEHIALPTDIPVWTVESTNKRKSGRLYKKVDVENTRIDGTFYEDQEKMASMYAYYKDNYIHYDGIFGQSSFTKIMRSVPEKWFKPDERNETNSHIIMDVNVNEGITDSIEENYYKNDEKLDEPLKFMNPKLLLVLEHDYFKSLGEDIKETIKYFTILWNAANLEYNKFTSPKIRLTITGIIIAKDDCALEFIYNSRGNNNEIDPQKLIHNAAVYFNEDFKYDLNFKNYDAVITLSGSDTNPIAGIAFMSGLCDKNRNTGFLKDDGNYSGLRAGIHEVGHLLSLVHDGLPGAEDCESYPKPDISTIMAPFAFPVRKLVWSKCSERFLQKFASSKAAECLKRP